MFRYRSLKNLLHHSELENNNIYFSDVEEDQHEGDISFYWKGDRIAWRNFLSHFYWTFSDLVALGTDKPYRQGMYAESNFYLFGSKYDVNRRGLNNFLAQKSVSDFLDKIDDKVSINFFELKFFLMFILPIAFSEYVSYKQQFNPSIDDRLKQDIVEKDRDENIIQFFSESNEEVLEQLYNLEQLKWSHVVDALFKKRSDTFKQIMATFPQNYIDTMCRIISPAMYIASFSKTPTDEVMWSRYANSNTGVCLEFRSDEKLVLKVPYSFSHDERKYEYRPFLYKKVIYSSQPICLNFFENIGSIRNNLLQNFLKDESGNVSICYQNMYENIDTWRKQYWDNWFHAYNRKMQNWAFEREYRIILPEFLDTYKEKKDRVLEYDVHNLKSITFGEKTLDSDKKKIIDIMKKKLGDTFENFEFYQQA